MGKAWKFGDSISTDVIAPGRYFHLRSNLPELSKHVLEPARPEFALEVKKGDFVVAGENFGLGSSREHAPMIIKIAGVKAVLAKSFARIFYRNCINIGLPAITCNTDEIGEGDELELDMEKGLLRNKTKGIELEFPQLPPVMNRILREGGLVAYIKAHKSLEI
ncbi:MAG: 3-isopropylmalate dehydratase small subunit [Candidatus Methanoperedens sp.]|nr:3-isopropylmalate dehydratase small subunit [Candidatus Methanoperedens sp.]